jgi:hypothetical protein
MKIKTTLLVLLFTLQLTFHLFSQQFITIKGNITDSKSMEPIGFASISLKNEAIGTICNALGAFVFHIPNEKINDTLLVSSMGYQSYAVSVKSIANKELNIELTPKVYTLLEAKVKPLDPLEIIKKAIAKIPENYPTEPNNMDGFYREMTFENDTCVEMAEAACEFYYRPYNEEFDIKAAVGNMFVVSENYNKYFFTPFQLNWYTNPNDRLRIIEARASSLNHKQRFKVVPKGGALAMTGWDMAKYKNLILLPKIQRQSKFKLEDIDTYNDRMVYVISYNGKRGRFDSGKMFIDIETHAFVAFQIKTSPDVHETDQYWTPALYIKKRNKCDDREELTNETINVNYKQIRGKWYLNTVQTELAFDYVFSKYYRFKNINSKISYKIKQELLINKIILKNVHEVQIDSSFANSVFSTLCDYDLDYNPAF